MATNRSRATKDQSARELRIRLRKSTNRRLAKHRACVAGLGLRRIGDEVCLPDRAEIRGMVNRVRYLLEVEEIAHKPPKATASKPKGKAQAQPEAKPRAKPKAKPKAEAKPKAKAAPKTKAEAKAKPKTKTKTEAKAKPKAKAEAN